MSTPQQIARAFAIADQTMYSLLESEGVAEDMSRTTFGFTDADCREVDKLALASPALREAFEWLRDRGYVRLAEDVGGQFIEVVRRPGDDGADGVQEVPRG